MYGCQHNIYICIYAYVQTYIHIYAVVSKFNLNVSHYIMQRCGTLQQCKNGIFKCFVSLFSVAFGNRTETSEATFQRSVAGMYFFPLDLMCFCCSWKSGETLSCLLNHAFNQQKQGNFTFCTLLSVLKPLLQSIKFMSVFPWQIWVTSSVILKEKQCHQNYIEKKQLLVLMLLQIDFLFAFYLVIVC